MRYLLTLLLSSMCVAAAAEDGPLTFEAKIPLPEVKGRIDHLAIDVAQKQLFVAALGNDTVEVVDLGRGTRARSLTGLHEPQGIAYSAATKTLYVANGGDGSLRTFQSLTPSARVELGDDADNVRMDTEQQRIYVGYGNGALAAVDSATNRKLFDIPLDAHPESFQLEKSGSRIFVNVPDAGEIAVLDRRMRKQIAAWQTNDLRAGYPLALDEANERVIAVFRHPAVLATFDMESGHETSRTATCGDADDVFIDGLRGLIYVICGEGFVDVFATGPGVTGRRGRVRTAKGARTALFSSDSRRLYVAAPAIDQTAAIWIFRAPD
jgi:hypothetical protein